MKKTILMVCIISLCVIVHPKLLVAQDLPAVKTIDQYTEEIFGDDARIGKAVIFHESNNKLDAINYNCVYPKYDKDGKPVLDSNGKQTYYSTSCKSGDENNAWSVDCGIGQINVLGKVCPDELLTLDGNMAAIKRIYDTQGLNAWVSYKTGRYKKYL